MNCIELKNLSESILSEIGNRPFGLIDIVSNDVSIKVAKSILKYAFENQLIGKVDIIEDIRFPYGVNCGKATVTKWIKVK